MELNQWLPIALAVVSVVFFVYGALIAAGKWTPIGAKVLVEPEFIKEWCKSEGKTKMIWGVDMAFAALYFTNFLLPILWAACFVVLAVYCTYLGYKNNQKYMKN